MICHSTSAPATSSPSSAPTARAPTLFNAIAGSFLTDAGKILLDGQDVTLRPEHKRARLIGRLFQDPMRGTAPGMTVEEKPPPSRRGAAGSAASPAPPIRPASATRVALLGMGLEDRMRQEGRTFSGGQRQALTLMTALNLPSSLLLDGPLRCPGPGHR